MIGTRTGLLRANVLRVFGFLGGGLCLGVMLGCKSSSSHASHEADSAVFALSRDPLKGRELSTVQRLLQNPVDLKAIKALYRNCCFTSTMASLRGNFLWKPDTTKGFFGIYTLLRGGTLAGNLIVYSDVYPWYYENDTDVFVMISVYDSSIVVMDSVQVGRDTTWLKAYLGPPMLWVRDCWFYHDKIYTIASFYMEAGRVRAYSIVRCSADLRKGIIPLEAISDCIYLEEGTRWGRPDPDEDDALRDIPNAGS